jgi:excisionase family DNA binding protein
VSGDIFPSLVLTVSETARILGIGRNQAYGAIRRGDIPSIRMGRRILVPRHALEQLLNRPVINDHLGSTRVDDHAS